MPLGPSKYSQQYRRHHRPCKPCRYTSCRGYSEVMDKVVEKARRARPQSVVSLTLGQAPSLQRWMESGVYVFTCLLLFFLWQYHISRLAPNNHPLPADIAGQAYLRDLIQDHHSAVPEQAGKLVRVDRNTVRAHLVHWIYLRDQITRLDEPVHLISPFPTNGSQERYEKPRAGSVEALLVSNYGVLVVIYEVERPFKGEEVGSLQGDPSCGGRTLVEVPEPFLNTGMIPRGSECTA
jgi:hypothetical protein